MIKIVLYDENHPFNSERTVPVFQYATNIIFERKLPTDKVESDIALVHSQMNYDMSDLKSDLIILFDCEDQFDIPDNIGESFQSLKNIAKYYAKSHYRPSFPNGLGMKYINMPHPFGLISRQYLNIPQDRKNISFTPIFFGSGTFIGNYDKKYKPKNLDSYFKSDNLSSIGYVDGVCVYSQRVEWLGDLRANNIDFVGGISRLDVNNNLGIEWQKKVFGKNVEKIMSNRISKIDLLKLMMRHKIFLSPSGMGRWTTRLWDAAAMGGIIICTDMHDYQMLPSPPRRKITIEDGNSLASFINQNKNEFPDFYVNHLSNAEDINSQSPNSLVEDFLDQI